MPLLALALLQGAALAAPAASTAEPVRAAQDAPEQDLLFFEAELEASPLTDALAALGDPADPFLPLGELSRLLDLAIDVDVPGRAARGTIGRERRPIRLDLKARTGSSGGGTFTVQPGDARVSGNDIFLRAALVEALLPVRVAVDAEALTVRLSPTETLPVQERRARLARASTSPPPGSAGEEIMALESSYQAASAPGFDLVLEGGYDSREGATRRFDLRAAGDLLYGTVQAYVGSDRTGRPRIARFLYEKRSHAGDLPLGVRRFAAGDVFAPGLALGPRSTAGRGVTVSNVPTEQLSVFDTVDLRGELPAGHDVELFVNEVLRGSQSGAVEGRYEFLAVPLSFGINRIRIVLHGPRGEVSEEARTINVGGGQLRAGETWFEAGLTEQERALVEPGGRLSSSLARVPVGAPRLTLNVSHGLSTSLTVIGGVALYSPTPGGQRQMASAGVRTSIGSFAVQADAGLDNGGGAALSLGAAGRVAGVSAVVQHAEYRGDFVDENALLADTRRPIIRRSSIAADTSLPLGGRPLPLSFRLMRIEHADGGSLWAGGARLSTSLGSSLISAGLDYQRETSGGAGAQERLSGGVSASAFLGGAWQIRGALDYELLPQAQLRTISLSADRSVSEGLSLRLGMAHAFVGRDETSFQAGPVLRLPFGDIAMTANHAPQRGDWHVGLRLSLGSLFDPVRQRYVLTRPGPSAGGAVAFHAFNDRNGNGRFDKGEEPLAGVAISGGEGRSVTSATGHALATGFGTASQARLEIDLAALEDVTLAAPPALVGFRPRPGQVVRVPYPLAQVGEAYFRLVTQQPDRIVGISALRVTLVGDDGRRFEATTQYDGSAVFGGLPLGRYTLELDPEQAARLRILLVGAPSFALGPDETPTIEAEVQFGAAAMADAAAEDRTGG